MRTRPSDRGYVDPPEGHASTEGDHQAQEIERLAVDASRNQPCEQKHRGQLNQHVQHAAENSLERLHFAVISPARSNSGAAS